MNEILQLVVLGAATGSLYALGALGIIVTHRASGVLNLANGAFAMVSGYTMYAATGGGVVSPALGAILGVLVAVLISGVTYAVVIRPLSQAAALTRIVATLAVYVVLQSVIQIIFGAVNKIPSSLFPEETISLWGFRIGVDRAAIIGIALVVTGILWAIYRYTRFGLATTAVAENPRALAALGWRVGRVQLGNWAISGLVGGIAGVLIAPITQLTPSMMLMMLVPTLAVAMIGGMKSFPIALLGGMVLGALQVLASAYVPIPGASQIVTFIAIIVVLILLGRTLPARGTSSARLPAVGTGRIAWVPIVVVFAVLISLALTVFDWNMTAGATSMAAIAIIGLSQVVITGYAGQLSLAQMSMAGIGGLVAAMGSALLNLPFIVAILLAVVVVIPFGLLVGIPALRTRGNALAVATLGFGAAVSGALLTNSNVNGGVGGYAIGPIDFLGISLNPHIAPVSYMVFSFIWLLVIGLVVTNLRRGRTGRRLLAIRTNERAAAALGINVSLNKLYAFTLSAMIAAVGGVLLIYMNSYAVLSSGFDVLASINLLAFTVLGGIGYIGGPIVASGFNTASLPTQLIQEWLSGLDLQSFLNVALPLIGGLALILQLSLQPGGAVDAIVRGRSHSQRLRRAKRGRELALEVRRPQQSRNGLSTSTRALSVLARTRNRKKEQLAQALDMARQSSHAPRGALLEVDGVTVQYGSVVAVDDITFQVKPGEVLGIIGPNGAGKTSLMDAITGFAPMRGSVRVDGVSIEKWPAHRRSRSGLVRSFQTLELLEDMTVIDNLRAAADTQDLASFVLDLVRPKRGALTPAITTAIDTCEIEILLQLTPQDLPYGDRHLVAIARAVAANPRVLLLDEPAAGLSSHERDRLKKLIRRMAKEWQLAIVLIEHDVELVKQTADRILAIDFGRAVVEGPPDEVLGHKTVVEAYLGEAWPSDELEAAQ